MTRVRRRLITAITALGSAVLVAWVLMLLPPVNDAVLGDKPRELEDFARMCEDGGSGEPFPRAASYEPGAAPHPWVVIEDEWDAHSSTGRETKEPEWGEEPDPEAVQLVACSVVSGSVPDTEITCEYSRFGVGEATQSVEFSQGRYTVHVREARTGDLVLKAALEGDEEVECFERTAEGNTEPVYSSPTWDAYADLFAEVDATPSGS
jgi:hypothetical protein